MKGRLTLISMVMVLYNVLYSQHLFWLINVNILYHKKQNTLSNLLMASRGSLTGKFGQACVQTGLYDTSLLLLLLLLSRIDLDNLAFSSLLPCSFSVPVKGMKYSSKIWRRNLKNSEKFWSVYNRSSRKLRACLLAKPNAVIQLARRTV